MQEDIFVLIESYQKDFTDVEKIIAHYFLGKNKEVTIGKLAHKLSVSQASITRFCKKIGLGNYKELIFLYKRSLSRNDDYSVATMVTSAYHALATRSENNYSAKAIDAFCEQIHSHKIIHFYGKGFNSFAGEDFHFKFSRVGKYVRVISNEKSILMSARFVEKDELIIVSSLRGNDEDMLDAMKIAKDRDCTILLVTSNAHSALIQYAEVVLYAAGLTREEAQGNVSPQIPILMQFDMVYEEYVRKYADSIVKWLASESILYTK